MRGACQNIYMAQGISQVLYDSQFTLPSAIFFVHTTMGSTLDVILYFLVVWLGEIFCSTQNVAKFDDQEFRI